MEEVRVLNGMPAILRVLGIKSRTTFRHYVKYHGLPVHHDHENGRVWALESELVAWRLERIARLGETRSFGPSASGG